MNSSQKKIYLTFDEGPIPTITSWVLDVLKLHNIAATFFCVGENVVKHPELFQRIITEKHSVGNHTYHHLNGWKTHTDKYLQNVEKCAEVVNSKLFRPPYGRLKKSQYSMLIPIATETQYSIIMWDILSGDYDKNTSPEKCLNNITGTVRNGSIIVFHDSYKAKKNIEYTLPRFIEYAKTKGFEFGVL